ncbi:hypothetical protein CPC08DRAFT_752019 [Agrocybe pediades]|nr:hypothetical protein CPC08DRAFT_752019 [Agrocybe pediades]
MSNLIDAYEFPTDWSLPTKPGLATEPGQVQIFGFQIHPTQVVPMGNRFGIDTSLGYTTHVNTVFKRLRRELPRGWRKIVVGSWRRPEGGPQIPTKVVWFNSNINEAELDKVPDKETMKLVSRLICATEGPRWYKYVRKL